MKKRIRIGILGCANIAKKSAIPAFQALDNAEVISIASRDKKKAKEYASLFSLPFHESYDSLLENPQVDAVYIPLPLGLHKKWIIKAIKAGKHVISEKSLTTDFQAAKEIVKIAKAAKIVLYENFMCGFHPQHQKVLSLINKGEIGKPFLFKSHFCIPMMDKNNFRYNKSLGGSALYEVGWYPVFMARKILQSEPISVTAHLFYDKKKGIDMAGVAQLTFKDEETAQIAFSLDSLYQNNYSILGTKGLINVKRAHTIPADMKPQIELVKNEDQKELVTQIDAPAFNHFELIFEDFCKTILDNENNPRKKEQIYTGLLAQAKVQEAIKISSEQKMEVWLKELV